jgi:predicted NBD/HSP70 family sugar kinase
VHGELLVLGIKIAPRTAKGKGKVEEVIDEAANSLGNAIDTATDSMRRK